jgi:prepilin-type N-terminal cleavage/methylation domain-containing protein
MNSSARLGFTLVELLVVVSILVILTATMIPSFTNYSDSQNIKQAQEAIKNDLRLVQNRALTQSYPPGDTNRTAQYWGISFTQGSNIYTTLANDEANCDTPMYSVPSVPLSSDVTAKETMCVLFSLGNGDPTNSATVGVTLKQGSDDKAIVCTNPAGLIYSPKDVLTCSTN